ncbi:hypothetical protein CFK37_18045 [Virgibacillus phasianinus]|uniref:DUF4047 domain-containing protein n=1 Tax=Virgibacillus phasianinus TaxID=2017483 RepID=A0A220U7T4_9BACI|nr:DUF4047 domain-containing protein [Virgibacillus phasianinus]ASK63921.1 hypothetical protein CFK37_18045 [Virgibacillus phasianinus]
MNLKKQPYIVLLCLCCITFYIASYAVDETEAVFVDRETTTTSITAAIVFPRTIEGLVKETKEIAEQVNHIYTSALQVQTENLSLQEVKANLSKLKAKRETIMGRQQVIKKNYNQIKAYDQQAAAKQFQFLQDGLVNITGIYQTTSETVDIQRLDHLISKLKKAMKKPKQNSDSYSKTPPQSATTEKTPSKEKTAVKGNDSIKETSREKTEKATEKPTEKPLEEPPEETSQEEPPEPEIEEQPTTEAEPAKREIPTEQKEGESNEKGEEVTANTK